jgi:hypothetical protein
MSTSKREIAALPSGHVGIYRAVRQLGARGRFHQGTSFIATEAP